MCIKKKIFYLKIFEIATPLNLSQILDVQLIYAKCSRYSCTSKKEKDNYIKLWHETNDGMFLVCKGCKPDNDFGIIGLQVAGSKLYLNILTRDMYDVCYYYHLDESEILI